MRPARTWVCAAPAAPSTQGALTSELLLPVTPMAQGRLLAVSGGSPIPDQHLRNYISIYVSEQLKHIKNLKTEDKQQHGNPHSLLNFLI